MAACAAHYAAQAAPRAHSIVTPSPEGPGLAAFATGWACGQATGVFLDYGAVPIHEDGATPFDKDPGRAAGHFEATAADGDGHTASFDGFPRLVALAEHGRRRTT